MESMSFESVQDTKCPYEPSTCSTVAIHVSKLLELSCVFCATENPNSGVAPLVVQTREKLFAT